MIKAIGIALIVFGLSSVFWGGFTYKTHEKVLDIGPIEATREKTHHLPVAPLAGGLAVVAGVVLLVLPKG